MRLIDADALKKDVEDNSIYFGFGGVKVIEVDCAKALIDNAPTVIPDNDIFEWCTDCKEYDQEKHCCHRWTSKIREVVEEVKQYKLDELRPQGEWIYGEDDCGQDGWFCSECNFFVPWYYQYYKKDIDFIRDYKACPHCLAEMVTYTGKDRDTKGGAE